MAGRDVCGLVVLVAAHQSIGRDRQHRMAQRWYSDCHRLVSLHRFSLFSNRVTKKHWRRSASAGNAPLDFLESDYGSNCSAYDLVRNYEQTMVRSLRWTAACLLLVSIIIGTVSDRPRQNPRLMLGGYHVLAADFHIHSFPLSWGVLSPWDTLTEARRQALDVIAMTPHNHIWVAKFGQWLSRLSGETIVLVGEEIHSNGYHLLAVGIRNTIDWRQQAGNAIDEVHRQGGVAIAAHPIASFAAYDADAIRKLDGAEIVHPIGLRSEALAAQLRQFFGRGRLTAIGDTDYHLGPMSPQLGEMGLCRTYVFARERNEKGILDALREGRTVVYDRENIYGDPSMIQLAEKDGRLMKLASSRPQHDISRLVSEILGVFGLLVWSSISGGTWGRLSGRASAAVLGRTTTRRV
jgi:predicted metal-dependent phosphoesterase TrpH